MRTIPPTSGTPTASTAQHRRRHEGGALLALLALLLFLSQCRPDQPSSPGGTPPSEPRHTVTNRYPLPGDNTFPEGIAVDRKDGVAYVGSTTSGDVFGIDLDSGDVRTVSPGGAPGRTQAVGLELTDDLLVVAGGATGHVAVLDTDDGTSVADLATPAAPQTFLNDAVAAPDGYVYVTDSMRPVLFRFALDGDKVGDIEPWLDLSTTPITYGEGFNLNGIELSEDGTSLLTVQSNTGQLWRIDLRTGEVTEVELVDGVQLTDGDGLLLWDGSLYVVRNADGQIVELRSDNDFATARQRSTIEDPNLRFPTTVDTDGESLLVVNGQLDAQAANTPPVLPFEVIGIDPGNR